jgi:hypothetical protein
MNAQTERYATQIGVQEDIKWLWSTWTKHIRDAPEYVHPATGSVHAQRIDKFLDRLHSAAGSDAALRATQGYRMCIWGVGKSCPSDGPMRCGGHEGEKW